jgi:hypothetical protein
MALFVMLNINFRQDPKSKELSWQVASLHLSWILFHRLKLVQHQRNLVGNKMAIL